MTLTEFEKKVASAFGAILITDKKAIPLARQFAKVVDIFTPISSEDFLENYTQTIHRWIFLAEKWDSFSIEDRESTIVHECAHVVQFAEDLFMPTKYLANTSERARYEADAKSAAMQFLLDTYRLDKDNEKQVKSYILNSANRLRQYGCTLSEADFVYSKLISDYWTYKAKGYSFHPVAEKAVEIYESLKK